MKKLIAVLVILALGLAAGVLWHYGWGPPPLVPIVRATAPAEPAPALEQTHQHPEPSYICPMHPQVVRHAPDRCPICGMDLVPRPAEELSVVAASGPPVQEMAHEQAHQHAEPTYICPMHPQVVRHAPDRCPICGMDLVLQPGEKLPRLTDPLSPGPSPARGEGSKETGAAPPASRRTAGPAIRVASAIINQLGVRTALVRQGSLERHLEAVGAYFEVTAVAYRGSIPQEPDTGSKNVVLAQVFEGHAPALHPGQAAEIRLPSLGGRTWKGTIESVDPQVNQGTRTLQFRVGFDPEGARLLPGSNARVRVQLDPIAEALLIPREVVIPTAEGARVMVALGGGRFEPRPVHIDDFGENEVVVRSGLDEGEEVVVSAQFLLDSEANLQAGLLRFSSGGEGSPSPGAAR